MEASNLFALVDETKVAFTHKVEALEKQRKNDVDRIRKMHKNDLKFPAPLPKQT
jgi:hypothetical protein